MNWYTGFGLGYAQIRRRPIRSSWNNKMQTVTVTQMSRKRGRPKNEAHQGTRMVRINDDLADMLSWVARVEGGTVAQLVDTILRPQIIAKYQKYEPVIRAIQKAEAELEKAKKQAEKYRDQE